MEAEPLDYSEEGMQEDRSEFPIYGSPTLPFLSEAIYLNHAHQQEGLTSDSLAKLDVGLDIMDLSLEATALAGEMGTSVDVPGFFEGIFSIFEGLS